MIPLIAISTGTTAVALGQEFWDFPAALAGAVGSGFDNLEVVLLAEWMEGGPVSPTSADPARVVKPTRDEVVLHVHQMRRNVRVTSVHGNRDIGALWALGGSAREPALSEARFALELAGRAGALCVVLHAWDPNATKVTAGDVIDLLHALLLEPPRERAQEQGLVERPVISVENVPISDSKVRPEHLLRDIFNACPEVKFTLDLTWASLYDNLDDLLTIGRDRLVNVHVQGKAVEGGKGGGNEDREQAPRDLPNLMRTVHFVPRFGRVDLRRALRRLVAGGFTGPYTIELVGARGRDDFLRARGWLTGVLADCHRS